MRTRVHILVIVAIASLSIIVGSVVLRAQSVPSIPTQLSAAVSSPLEIDLAWADSNQFKDVKENIIYRCSGAGCSPAIYKTLIPTDPNSASTGATTMASYSDLGVLPNTTYRYAIAVINSAGTIGSESTILTVATPADMSTKFSVGDTAKISGSPVVNVRVTPSSTGTVLGTVAQGRTAYFVATSKTVSGSGTGLTEQFAEGRWWWKVSFAAFVDNCKISPYLTGVDCKTGWVAEQFLTKVGAPAVSSGAVTAKLLVDGVHSQTVPSGSARTYTWSSTNADEYSSTETSNNPAHCGGSASWKASSVAGSYTHLANPSENLAGCTITISYVAKNSKTGLSATASVTVTFTATTATGATTNNNPKTDVPSTGVSPTDTSATVPSSPSSSVSNAGVSLTTNLYIGSRGDDVSNLQEYLIAEGYSIPSVQSGRAQSGYFGPETSLAVEHFQEDNGIRQTGTVGPITRAALNGENTKAVTSPSPSPTPVISISPTPSLTSIPSQAPASPSLSPIPVHSPSPSPVPSQTPIVSSTPIPSVVTKPLPSLTPIPVVSPNPSVTPTPSQQVTVSPSISLTIDGQHAMTYAVGQTIHYGWTSANADTIASSYTSNNPTVCGAGQWVATTPTGVSTKFIDPQLAGCVWTVAVTVRNNDGNSAVDVVTATVESSTSPTPSPSTSPSAPKPSSSAAPLPITSPSTSPQADAAQTSYTASVANFVNTIIFWGIH